MKLIIKIQKKILFLLFSFLNLFNFRFKIRLIDNLLNILKVKILRLCGAKIGVNSFIHANTLIINPENLIIGNNSNIGSNSEIFNYNKVFIGDNVDIGTQFYINTNNHDTRDPNKLLAYQGNKTTEIKIGSDIWIGARVTILLGAEVENRVVIGAGSLVNKKTLSGGVYAGVPATKKRDLNFNLTNI